MNRYEWLAAELGGRYGPLFFELRKRDRAWDSFEVAWSDDGGKTVLAAEMTIRDLDIRLASCRTERLTNLFREARERIAANQRRGRL